MLLALTGTDGTGKSTVTRAVVSTLRARGYRARVVDRWDIVAGPDFPSASFLPDDVPGIRSRVADMPVVPRFLFLMWSMGMALQAGRPAAGDEVLVLDGYWMKHAAAETAYGLDESWVREVVSALPVPDVTVRLRLPLEDAWARKQGDLVPYECGMDPSTSRAAFLTHQRAIADRLDVWGAELGWTGVTAAAPVARIATEVADLACAVLAPNAAPHAVPSGAGCAIAPDERDGLRTAFGPLRTECLA
ncbi:thymidylate kinase [Streptomyces sp. NPDC053431]|uniref:thymidylate kinase n=1 Tax=Streptomyces sp. NPDC053431 TaxID=3365703 RepID=UPI0037D231E8